MSEFYNVKNVSELFKKQAELHPDKKSIVFPEGQPGSYNYTYYTFKQLNEKVNQICHKLVSLGVKPGHKVLFFVKPNLDFCAITFALFRMGATPVFIDPGMKKSHFFSCIRQVKPDVLLGIPSVHILKRFFPRTFSKIKIHISTGKLQLLTKSLYKNLDNFQKEFDIFEPSKNDKAAILFTSGGTGIPKGVVYTHDIFINQTRMLQKEFNLTHEDTDIPAFPLFSFFTLAMGMTSCIPDMDPSKPAKCDPGRLYRNIMDQNASFIAGSPAIWERLANYCDERNLELPTKYVVMFGAPVSVELHRKFSAALPNGTTYTPYGATECLPVSNISGRTVLDETFSLTENGMGTCIGKPLDGIRVKIIKETDEVIPNLSDAQEVADGEVGEIIINSPNVTKEYYLMPEKTAEAKIYEGENVWHRMGDVGRLDDSERLWFYGRKKHVVSLDGKKMYPIPAEAIFNQHEDIKRTALVLNTKTKAPAIVIEKFDGGTELSDKLLNDVKYLGSQFEHTRNISEFHMHPGFPVDVRHNIKIDRSLLSKVISEAK